jgi:Phosphatidylglycerophosphatase A and related proteins
MDSIMAVKTLSLKRISIHVAAAAASGFGLGRAPVASGTFGALLGCVIVWGMTCLKLGLPSQIAVCAALALLSVPICGAGEKHFHEKDPGQVVADEYLTFPICMLGLYDKWMEPENWWLMPACFVVSRFMDIVKPFPAYRSQKLPGGLGIAIDDFIANLYALAANLLIWRAASTLLKT